MIEPKDPPGAPGVLPNPHYQIIAIILPNGEGDIGRSFITKFNTFHSNQTFILDMTQRIDSLKKRAREMYSRKWIFVDVDSTPKKKMDTMYELCEMLKDGYVDSYDRHRERPHLVMFFSTIQTDFKQLSLAKWYIRKPSSKQELDRYLVVCKNYGGIQEKEDDE